MNRFITILLFGIVGAVLASANVNVSNWQFWAVLVCMIGSNICSYVRGL